MSDIEDFHEDEELDWLYIEDVYGEVDELAEQTCPSPLPEVADDSWWEKDDDYDPYHYFEDLTYLSDSYYDADKPRPRHTGSKDADLSKKRKLATADNERPAKRIKSDSVYGTGPVKWRSRKSETLGVIAKETSRAELDSFPKVALFKDWKHHFKDSHGIGKPQTVEESKIDRGEEADDEQEADEDAEGAETSDAGAIDLGDLSAVAGLLTEENMGQLRAVMEAKGLDPAAVEVVLADLLAGREPELGDEEENGDEDKADETQPRVTEPAPAPQPVKEPAPPSRNQIQQSDAKRAPAKTEDHVDTKPPARATKRKHAASEDAAQTESLATPARGKRAKATPAVEPEPPPTLTKTTRSGRKRK